MIFWEVENMPYSGQNIMAIWEQRKSIVCVFPVHTDDFFHSIAQCATDRIALCFEWKKTPQYFLENFWHYQQQQKWKPSFEDMICKKVSKVNMPRAREEVGWFYSYLTSRKMKESNEFWKVVDTYICMCAKVHFFLLFH